MFGVGLQFHIEELLAVRACRHTRRHRAKRGRHRARRAHRALVRLELAGRNRLRHGARRREHGRAHPRARRSSRPSHADRAHRRRLARGRGSVYGARARAAAVLFAGGGSETSVLTALGMTALKVAALVGFTIVVGTRVIPFVLDHIADTGSRELFTLTVLTLALGIAVGSAAVFGVSMALGAFLAGLVVGRSDYSLRAASEALPMRDAFAVLFFVAVGMLLSPRLPARGAGPDSGDAGCRDDRQAADRARHRAGARLSVQGGAGHRRCAGADRRVLVHPVEHRDATWAFCRRRRPTRSWPCRSCRSC